MSNKVTEIETAAGSIAVGGTVIELAANESLTLGSNAMLANVAIVGKYTRFRLWLENALAALRRDLWALWRDSAVMTCPEHYAGGGWEPGACDGCRCEESGTCER